MSEVLAGHGHVGRGPLDGRGGARGPRLVRHRQHAARTGGARRRARLGGPARVRRASPSSSAAPAACEPEALLAVERELHSCARAREDPLPRRARRRADPPLRGQPSPPPLRGGDAGRRPSPTSAPCSRRSATRADLVIDTGSINTNQLRRRIVETFTDVDAMASLRVSLVTFGYAYGIPRDVDLVFDCRFLPNPHWIDELRPLTGLDEPVADYVLEQEPAQHFLADVVAHARVADSGLRTRRASRTSRSRSAAPEDATAAWPSLKRFVVACTSSTPSFTATSRDEGCRRRWRPRHRRVAARPQARHGRRDRASSRSPTTGGRPGDCARC